MDILHQVRSICARDVFQAELVDFLLQLCAIDTSPAQDLVRLRDNEARVFGILRSALEQLRWPGASIRWKAISPAIQDHPAFSQPYYAAGPVHEVYRGRGNLLFLLDRESSPTGIGLALNGHIDTVAPHFPPALSTDLITGRGTADDKGNLAVILGTLQVLAELERREVVSLKNKLTVMFVIDEETGGNGSLSLALDRTLKRRYDSLLVLECTGNVLHPANRGAVFIRCDGRLAHGIGPSRLAPCLLEAYAWAILDLLDAGETIRQESDHPLFPHRPVQTCTGILGPFGQHPSTICGQVSVEYVVGSDDLGRLGMEQLRGLIERGVGRYVARYGDKTQTTDPQTGAAKVKKHFDIDWQGDGRCLVTVYGAAGHMGSLPQNDAAITKWAYVVRELIEARRALGLAFRLEFPSVADPDQLVFEGAQGFLPTHSMEEIKARTRAAFLRGIDTYLAEAGWLPDAISCEVSFDKLHNDAFACDPDSDSMHRAVRTALDVGLAESDRPLRGWEVSCDARLFAREYPGLPVITFGAGHLEQAHSNQERVHVADLLQSIGFVSLFVLRETDASQQ
jgi:acetylornithine deacetylase/succinyl-diaminopimelate desuccinylase-like protein